jgi:hypothetical protein
MPLEIYLYILNILLIGIILLWLLYIKNMTTNKIIFMWITFLFFINLFNIRITIIDYLKNSERIGDKGTKGIIGNKGNKGKDRKCGCDNNKIIIKLSKKTKEWVDLILSYNQGEKFLNDYFYIDYSWQQLLNKNENITPFDIIKKDEYWK